MDKRTKSEDTIYQRKDGRYPAPIRKTEQELIKEVKEVNHEKKSRHVSRQVLLLTLEQARQFLSAAKSDPLEAFYILALTTGMHWGDLLTLKWEDLDPTPRRLLIGRTVPQRGPGRLQISEQKTKTQRCIVLTTLASEALTRHRLRQDEQRLAAGESWEDHGLIFCNDVGKSLDASHIRRRSFVPLRERAGLASLRFHVLRPSAALLLLMAGADLRVMQEMFGERNSSMTADMNTSSSTLLSLQEEVAQRLNSMLLDGQKPASPFMVNGDKRNQESSPLAPNSASSLADKESRRSMRARRSYRSE